MISGTVFAHSRFNLHLVALSKMLIKYRLSFRPCIFPGRRVSRQANLCLLVSNHETLVEYPSVC